MWQIKWLRRLVRRNTRPIQQQEAANWKERLSIVYAIIAWNAFGVVIYMLYTGRKDWAKFYGYKTEADELASPGKQWAKTFNVEKATIIRLSGLQIKGEEEYRKPQSSSVDNSIEQQQESLIEQELSSPI